MVAAGHTALCAAADELPYHSAATCATPIADALADPYSALSIAAAAAAASSSSTGPAAASGPAADLPGLLNAVGDALTRASSRWTEQLASLDAALLKPLM